MSFAVVAVLIIGLVDFIGGILLIVSLSRHARVRQIENALYPEIVFMQFQAAALANEIARRRRSGLSWGTDLFRDWRLTAPLIYPALGADLGLLSRDAIDRLGYFHSQLQEARTRVAEAKSEELGEASPYRLLANLIRACNHVQPWITGLEPRLGKLIDCEPDLSQANELLTELELSSDHALTTVPYAWMETCVPVRQFPKT